MSQGRSQSSHGGSLGHTLGVFVGDAALPPSKPVAARPSGVLQTLLASWRKAGTKGTKGQLPIRGVDVACASLTEALLRTRPFERCEIYRLPRTKGLVGQLWSNGKPPNGVSLYRYEDLFRQPLQSRFTTWFDPAGIFTLPLQIRARAVTEAYPITSVLHTLNHHWMLHQWTLPVILGSVEPYDSIVCPSCSTKRSILEIFKHVAYEFNREFDAHIRYRGRVDVIPLCVDTERFRPREKAPLRSLMGLPKDGLLLLYIGRLSLADKADLFPLLLALKRLQTESCGCRIRLALAGSDQEGYADALMRQARDLGVAEVTHIVPGVHPDERHLFHAAGDIFVCPSDSVLETFALTVVEAMACGVPQVVADWDGLKDSVRHGETGFRISTMWAECDSDLCEMGQVRGINYDYLTLAQSVAIDHEQLLQRLRLLVQNPALRQRMAERSRQRALENYSYEAIMKQYSSLWTELSTSARFVPSPPRNPAYSRPAFYRWYKHFASTTLDDTTEVCSVQDAESRLGPEELLASYRQVSSSGIIDGATAQDVLDGLAKVRNVQRKELGSAKFPATMGEMVALVARRRKLDTTVARRHFMWLIKHGFVSVPSCKVK